LCSSPQEKAKPAARQERKITGLTEDSRIALKKVARLFFVDDETPRSKLRGISTKDISNNNAASSGVFTLRENKSTI
jgi:hypothetical protein